jgi:hypothetical protein
MACTTCLVCFISAVHVRSQKMPWKTGASSGHITNLKQSILSFDIYGMLPMLVVEKAADFLTCLEGVGWKSVSNGTARF